MLFIIIKQVEKTLFCRFTICEVSEHVVQYISDMNTVRNNYDVCAMHRTDYERQFPNGSGTNIIKLPQGIRIFS